MTLQQIKQQLKGCKIDSQSLNGTVLYDGLSWLLNNHLFKPSKAQIKQLYNEYLINDLQPLGEFQKGLFYEL